LIYSRVIGTGSALPEQAVSNAELAARGVDTSDEWIQARTGIKTRYLAAPDQTSSDLALGASRNAIVAAGIAAEDLDLIIVATSTPDYIFPSTACLLQEKLGIHGCAAFDLQAVCSGFVYALATADKFIKSGQHKCALVVGAEVFSRILDWSDRATCVLFGDGAGAMILRADSKPGLMASCLHADGSYNRILAVAGNVCGGKVTGHPFLTMDGGAVFKFAVKVLDEVGRETLNQCGMTPADVDWLIPHQANVRILDATARKLGIPAEKVIVTVDRHGNTSAASIPLAFDVAARDGRLQPGQRILLEGVGGGFTWGATLLEY
jgi:3-oxoacyl-[acyl-carrier-protein] synthase III